MGAKRFCCYGHEEGQEDVGFVIEEGSDLTLEFKDFHLFIGRRIASKVGIEQVVVVTKLLVGVGHIEAFDVRLVANVIKTASSLLSIRMGFQRT